MSEPIKYKMKIAIGNHEAIYTKELENNHYFVIDLEFFLIFLNESFKH